MNVKEKVDEAIHILNEIDEYDNTLSDKLYNYDNKTQDLLHLIENKPLKTNQCYRIVKELKNIRLERRKVKQDIELMKTYRQNQQKLLNLDSRKFIMPEIGKMEKQLNSIYKNRVYTDEELNNMVGV